MSTRNGAQSFSLILLGCSASALVGTVNGGRFDWLSWVYIGALLISALSVWVGSKPARVARQQARIESSIAAIEKEVSRPLLDSVKSAENETVSLWLGTSEGKTWKGQRDAVLVSEAENCSKCEARWLSRVESYHEELVRYYDWSMIHRGHTGAGSPDRPKLDTSACRCPDHTFDAQRELARTFPVVMQQPTEGEK